MTLLSSLKEIPRPLGYVVAMLRRSEICRRIHAIRAAAGRAGSRSCRPGVASAGPASESVFLLAVGMEFEEGADSVCWLGVSFGTVVVLDLAGLSGLTSLSLLFLDPVSASVICSDSVHGGRIQLLTLPLTVYTYICQGFCGI
jgi:hypothetical protein